jgi:P-type Mg2+ transporter
VAVLGRQFRSAVLVLLLLTGAASYLLGEHTESIIIGVILAASILLGFRQRVPR